MRQAALVGRSRAPLVLAGVLAANALIAFGLGRGELTPALAVALLPLVLIAFGALVARNRSILLFAALASPMIGVFRDDALISEPVSIYLADVFVLLGLAAWIVQRILTPRTAADVPRLRTPMLGWPLLLFGTLVVVAVVRGHESYGESFLGNPSRLLLYAVAAATILDGLTPKQIYKGLVVVFYSGTVWALVTAAFHLDRGTSQTTSEGLSTGGTRVLALSVSLYLAAALFLALLNLELHESVRHRALHLAVAGLATLGIILAFGRGTFAAVAVVVPLLLIGFRRIRTAIFGLLPLLLPFVALAVILIPQVIPDIGPTLADRVSVSAVSGPDQDQSTEGRIRAGEEIWEQVRESPIIGVGFGRSESFTLNGIRRTVSQNYHNSWLYLLAAGGVLLFSAFLLVCVVYAYEVIRRLRQSLEPHERLIVIWSAFTLFAFLINALAEPLFGWPRVLLTIWILLLLPAVVPVRPRKSAAPILAQARPSLSPSSR
jgi:O-antigen ligase